MKTSQADADLSSMKTYRIVFDENFFQIKIIQPAKILLKLPSAIKWHLHLSRNELNLNKKVMPIQTVMRFQ